MAGDIKNTSVSSIIYENFEKKYSTCQMFYKTHENMLSVILLKNFGVETYLYEIFKLAQNNNQYF